jgi:DNA-binding IclR family transcriptional regulator
MNEPTRTVSRALDILLVFSEDEPELTLTEISARLGMHKSTVHRMLSTLESRRFVQRDAVSGKYRLGTRILELACLVAEHNDLQRRARPYLYRLVGQFQETTDLSILDEGEVVYLEVAESPQRVKLAARPGQRLPAYATASGKAFLAQMAPDDAKALLPEHPERFTNSTYTSWVKLSENLRLARERGFAISLQEYEQGINAVAAPVLDVHGWPMAAIAVAGPAFRLSADRMLEIGGAVRAAADELAREVGSMSSRSFGPNSR